jgi:tRNA A-37 threonylcarbamoyl transferase component Bud32
VKRDAPGFFADRSLLRPWLLGARKAQIVLALCFLVGISIVPAVTEAVADTIFSPVTRGGFLGLGASRRRDPSAETLSTLLDALFWLGSATAVGWLLWLRIPVVVRAGQERDDAPQDGDSSDVSREPTMLAAAAAKTVHAQTAAAPATGTVPRYEVVEELGRGAMGVVYRARDRVLDRPVALKELSPELMRNEVLADRFRREARVLAKLAHANVVQVYDLDDDGTCLRIAMELVEGGSLADQLAEHSRLSVERTATIGAQMARALAYAHGRHVVHRDFKPDNVMMTREGVPKVADFGLAKLLSQAPELTQEGAILGSPAYMSPEQAGGRAVDARADAYAFGVTLYEMATGTPPFVGDTIEVITQHLTQAPRSPRELVQELPESLEALVLELLEKDPERRLADMTAVAERLEALG